ncbi:MAG: protein TolR [Pseudomonadales bacterium]
MARIRRRRKPVSEINVVPYIDVMLVLLVVFMVTAPLLTQGVSVDLPEAPSEPLNMKDNQEVVVVSVKADGSYYIDIGSDSEQPVSLDYIADKVEKLMRVKSTTPVLVRGDKAVPYGTIVNLMTRLQAAGVPNVGLISEPGQG